MTGEVVGLTVLVGLIIGAIIIPWITLPYTVGKIADSLEKIAKVLERNPNEDTLKKIVRLMEKDDNGKNLWG